MVTKRDGTLSRIYRSFRRKLRIFKRIWVAYNWKLRQIRDFNLASNLWGYKSFPFDLETIPLRESYQLRIELEPKLYHYNPSILFESKKLYLCWRVSNYKGSPKVNWARETAPNAPRFEPRKFLNAIALGEIANFNISDHPGIENQRLANQLAEFARRTESTPSKTEVQIVSTLIDPKFLDNNPGIILGNFESWIESPNGKYSVKQSMGILNFKEQGECTLIPFQESSGEKNWCYIPSNKESFEILRSSSPQIVLSVQKSSPFAVMNVEVAPSDKRFANGGSNFVSVNDLYFLRVARYRFSSPGNYNCHITIIIKHDRNLVEVSRTKPFIFRIFGYEICNGFQYHDEEFFFSWGENDERMFLGSIEQDKFLAWLERMWES